MIKNLLKCFFKFNIFMKSNFSNKCSDDTIYKNKINFKGVDNIG
jgi:hypothetical protein